MIDKLIFLPRLAVLAGLAFSLPVYAQYSTPMRDVDNGARQPVNFQVNIIVPTGSSQASDSTITVPAGKRLVIETISFNATVGVGQTGFLAIAVFAGGGTAAGVTGAGHVIPMVKLTGGPNFDIIGGIGAFRMYADPGHPLTLTYVRGTGDNGVSILVNITGHYVNLP